MRMNPVEVSQADHYRNISEALTQSTTAVFLDTSILYWMFRLAGPVRSEFIDWATTDLGNRLHVPVWAAHELHHALSFNTSALAPLRERVKTLAKGIEDVKRLVALAADPDYRRPDLESLPAYTAALEAAGADFIKLCGLAAPEANVNVLAASILPFVNERVLASDIFPSLRWIQGDFSARVVGRVPPGFKDAKSKADDNAYGDLMIWNEITERCAADESLRTVVLLTNDNKNDWVHRPPNVRDESGMQRGSSERGLETLLASPLLTHELSIRSGVDRFFIVNTTTLAVVLQRYSGKSIPHLFAAVQPVMPELKRPPGQGAGPPSAANRPPRPPGSRPSDGSEGRPGETSSPEVPVAIVELGLLLSPGLLDGELTWGGVVPLADVLAGLVDADPARQEAALVAVRDPSALEGASASAAFAVGRGIAAAARTGLGSASNLMRTFIRSTTDLAPEARAALFAGLTSGVYLENDGSPRPLPVQGEAGGLFAAASHPSLTPAVEWARAHLSPYADRYLLAPWDVDGRVSVDVSLERGSHGARSELLGLRQGLREIMDDVAVGSSDALTNLVKADGKATVNDVLRAAARRFSVPFARIDCDQPLDAKVFWNETKGFRDP